MKQVYAAYNWKEQPPADPFKFCPHCATRLTAADIGGRERQACPRCHFAHFVNPSPAIVLLIVRDDQVVLGKRTGDLAEGKWALPSGYVEFDEDFLSAAMREAKEETGLDVEIQSIVHVESAFLSPRYHFLAVYLLARVVGGVLNAGDDVDAVGWFPVAGPLPEMAFQPDIDLIALRAQNRLDELPVDPGA